MGTIALLVFLLIAEAARRGVSIFSPAPAPGPSPAPLPATPSAAAAQNAANAQAAANAAQAAANAAHAQATAAAAASQAPPPWPQATPAGLPPFPSGWEPAEPPGPAVVQRAWQLLPELWKSGRPGARKVEQTGGRWITYVAQFHGTKKGVTAFRVREGASAPRPSSSAPRPSSSAPRPSSPPLVLTSTTPAGSSKPTLRQGSGMGALTAHAPFVKQVQAKLGVTQDGKFGPGTAGAVRAFQSKRGLSPDGVVGPLTWKALDGGGLAAA